MTITLSVLQALIQRSPTLVSQSAPENTHTSLIRHLSLFWHMRRVSETQALPPVQVFDRTMVVKQLHVLEPQDLLITRADKGGLRPGGQDQMLFKSTLVSSSYLLCFLCILLTPSSPPPPLSLCFIPAICVLLRERIYLAIPPKLVQWTHWSPAVIWGRWPMENQ